jgi:UDP-glucose 4-epimerase
MAQPKVLVFGGLGFLGQYLTDELARRRYQVTVADLPGNPPADLPADFKPCDIMDRSAVQHLCRQGFDFVYNLAGFANLDAAAAEPYRTLELNVLGNVNILDALVLHPPKRFVYASSAYAMNDKGSFYGISKLTSEKIVEEYQRKQGLPFTILRYGSVYAERDFDNNYIYRLVQEALRTGKIVHSGDGHEVREYIHALDAARLSVDILEDEGFRNEHIILTGVDSIRRHDLFLMISEILGHDIQIELQATGYANHYKFTPYAFQPSVSRKLRANPHIDMGQGILECIRAVHEHAASDRLDP